MTTRGIRAPTRADGLFGVLLVEAHETARRTLARGLERAGFALEHMPDGEQALARLSQGDIDVVVTDVGTSTSEGEWLDRLATARPAVGICVMSDDPVVRDRVRRERGRRPGAWRCVSGTVQVAVLADVLRRLIEGRRWTVEELRGHRGSCHPPGA